ncbi:hypothetical protein [Brumimicrobium aurantiacum]|uniref:Uncharacterized protein n=1 Tax=Brumimicrobium aurantiacum TaxID=1737063 RepID=A0A3E1EUK6_9FLAO|nr:hypothetical protein [Brumimicrobium aurantiacum]RFC53244.1 hypothetical protein DXU93_14360 [Brumimicrobium aurantiacum]
MKKRLKNFLLGLSDGILPTFKNSITTDENGEKGLNYARAIAAFFGWLFFVALLKGWIRLDEFLSFIKIIFIIG